ncbi:MAG: dihydroneopterin aldolase [Proteobacteria bacterium]|nr:dihydroneopterin aldolase [Pseudomonadota bacterium]
MLFPPIKDRNQQYLDQVQLTGMLLSCVIGIFPNERQRKQPVTIDLCLYLNTRKAAKSTNIHDTLDYGAAVKEVSFILEQCEFLLIESAVEAVCQYFLATYTLANGLPQVDAVIVRIAKPSALTHGIVPAIQVVRQRSSEALPAESTMIYTSDQGSLILAQVVADKIIEFSNEPIGIKAGLTIGKWSRAGTPLRPRTTVSYQDLTPSLSHSLPTPQLILLCR